MNELFLRLLERSVSANWLVLCILLLRLLFRRAPKGTRVALWGLVGLRLILPVSLTSAFSLVPRAETIRFAILSVTGMDIGSTAPVGAGIGPALREGLAASVEEGTAPLRLAASGAAAVWAVGVAAMLLYALVSCAFVRSRVRAAVPLSGSLYQCSSGSSAFVLGLLHPRIYLPPALPTPVRDQIVAHERAHIQRGDHWIKPLGFLLLSLYWFDPLLWLAYLLLCRDIELACDERVIRELNAAQRADYSQALLFCSIAPAPLGASPLAFGEVGVKERVKNILHYKKPTRPALVAAAALCGVVAVCFLADPKMAPSANAHLDGAGETLTFSEFREWCGALPERSRELVQEGVWTEAFAALMQSRYDAVLTRIEADNGQFFGECPDGGEEVTEVFYDTDHLLFRVPTDLRVFDMDSPKALVGISPVKQPSR